MPRIKSVDVLAFVERTNKIGQDPDSLSRAFAITTQDRDSTNVADDLNHDLLRAVGADYCDASTRAVGGIDLPEHESSAFETAGYEIYMDGAGTGVSAATKGMSSEHLGLWLNSEDGRIYR